MGRIANRSSSKPRTRAGDRLSDRPGPTPRTLSPLVQRLARLDSGRHWVVSCYLKLEPRDRTRGKYLIKLKNRIKQRIAWLEQLGLGRDERDAALRDLTRVREHLEHSGNLPTGRGVAIFASTPLGLFEAIPLPQVFRSRLAVDRTPLIRELAALDDEFGLVVCAAYDRTGARFFKVTAFDVEEFPGLVAEDAVRTGRFHGPTAVLRPGPSTSAAGEHNFNQRIRVEKQRHYAQVAQRLFDMTRATPVRGIVLAGTGAEANAVRSHLHPYVARLVLGTARLNPKNATPTQVTDAVLDVRRAAERQWEAEHLAALREGVSTDWAVGGVEATLRALARGQVRTLLVDPEAAFPGWRCRASGRLTSVAAGCGSEGPADPVPDVVDDAIEEALRQRCQVDVIEDQRGRRALDGLGALLRFR